ncbi:RNA-binding S4 domain-containing protein [Sphingomonas sp. CFBP 8760]|nr:RNA-binding S4 domain-containing protein [Sphingomonas sp. CFBP 8760]
MRLDRFLWWARLTKTRETARVLAEQGRLRLDGRTIDRAHAAVRVGNILTFAGPGGRVRVIRIEALPTRRGPPAEGRGCYLDLQAANVSHQDELD